MSLPLDTSTIDNALEIVNNELLTRGYINEPILLNTVNWSELFDDQLPLLSITDKLYNNDKLIINIIHSLLQSINRSRAQQKLANESFRKKDLQIIQANEKVAQLEKKLAAAESKLAQVQLTTKSLSSEINELSSLNHLQNQDLIKMKNWSVDLKSKYKVELRKKSLEIDSLKNQLLDKKKLSSSFTYGFTADTNSNVIHNNDPIIDNIDTITISNRTHSTPAIPQESQDLITNLSTIIESIGEENYKYSKFITILNDYFATFSNQLAKQNPELPNPSNTIDLNEINVVDLDRLEKFFQEMDTFEGVAKPMLGNIYRLYHGTEKLVHVVQSPEDSGKVEQLKQELEVMTKNWQQALKTIDDWKLFKSTTDKTDTNS